MFSAVIFLIVGLIGLALYFLPTIIAQQKGHRSLGGIFALNLLLGWSLLGWIGALIWALSNPQPVVIVQNVPGYMPPQGYAPQAYSPQSYPQQGYAQQPMPVDPAAPGTFPAQPATVPMPPASERPQTPTI